MQFLPRLLRPIIDTMWVLDADLSFARVNYVKRIGTMYLLEADLSFARVHYIRKVGTMYLLDTGCRFQLCQGS